MPELPEVQTIVGDLEQKIKGDTIVGFWSDWRKAIRMPLRRFTAGIKNKKILKAERIGKYIALKLSGDKILLIHLKMTGHLLVKKEKLKVKSQGKDYFADRVNQYIHHIFYLKSGRTLEFSDVRKFGKIILVDADRMGDLPEIKKLGVDALNKNLTFQKLEDILKKKKTPIKQLLMDQQEIAGIGNIYASEILHTAGILPDRLASELNLNEKKRIYAAIKKILEKAIELRGTSDSDYRDTSGAPGKFQEILKVYRRAGKKCRKCDTIIQRSVIGQRSSFFCPQCQK